MRRVQQVNGLARMIAVRDSDVAARLRTQGLGFGRPARKNGRVFRNARALVVLGFQIRRPIAERRQNGAYFFSQ
ncbi:MAG: hypothetical protein JNJ55_09770 [Betaproteobacteria bacterium]|nr:hypothetical protein [Betaproteobacteria bacterium]